MSSQDSLQTCISSDIKKLSSLSEECRSEKRGGNSRHSKPKTIVSPRSTATDATFQRDSPSRSDPQVLPGGGAGVLEEP